jgi:isocitrate dehydrogenase (NAD+)
MSIRISELHGDGIAGELAQAVHTIADALPVSFDFEAIDWSLARREREGEAAIDEAETSMRANKLALKYPTVTRSSSPNAAIRRRLDFSVIYRPAISIEGVASHFKADVDLHIVRIATGGTYDDPGRRLGRDAAVSLRTIERAPCEQAAHYAFDLARRRGYSVTSASKHTIQRGTDGLFEAVVDDVRQRHYSDVAHHSELFDALLAKIVLNPEQYSVIIVANEYGDFLSDMASGLVGSLGTGASGNFAFDADQNVDVAMFDPAGGTAPDIAGRDLCNPSGMLLAFGMLLDHVGRYDLGHALRLALLEAIAAGDKTRDLGGALGCSAFTRCVVERLARHLPAQA